jgi:hypothetical protein
VNSEPNPDRRAPFIERLVDLRDECSAACCDAARLSPAICRCSPGSNAALDALDALPIEAEAGRARGGQ